MDLRSLNRPVVRPLAQLFTALHLTRTPLITQRGHKTTSRTKRALKLPPHDSFLPSRAVPFPAADTIIYNPPSSEASPAHTPFVFLPPNDPRRSALLRIRQTTAAEEANKPINGESITTEGDNLSPMMKYKRRTPRYNVTEEDIETIRLLRAEDPITWSVSKLAAKFDCSEVFIKMVAPASKEHSKWLQEKMEKKKARWGHIRTQAREERKMRAEMLYRGEL
ncbi:hypothetical protein E4U19_002371 [Claviceps sp. Clav32 group G5]|nr:hypothetical protein E4U40_003452 [Claviceps sp. LM458 group G5]KAG6026873.1 hypothetical protein E4U19_002371 [Claviceps sp. Clav32 group G5]KAG6047884.1 hypothetical protein E4U39_007940 [Claviceps sp. Clav50 group G5]